MLSSNFCQSRATFTFLFLLSVCIGSHSSAEPPPTLNPSTERFERYSYGDRPLPGELSELVTDYQPIHLHSKTIAYSNKTYAPINFVQQELTLTFDIRTQKAFAHAVIYFEQAQLSYPYFQLTPNILKAKLDDNLVSTIQLPDPDNAGEKYISLSQQISTGIHKLEIEYQLNPNSLSFQNRGVGILTDMYDISNAHFFETWGPTGFEDDAFEMTLNLEIQNSATEHKLFTNGQIISFNESKWKIQFPKYFTTSSFYFHLTNKSLLEARFVIQGKEKTIPITVYGTNQNVVNQAKNKLPGLFQELERDFGPYPHDNFTAYLNSAGAGGGMEYSGATISPVTALDHELFHSWFARGVMPAEGRSGWIDEAFASWRDHSYFQAPSLLSRTPTFLGNGSPFQKETPGNCYVDGRQMMAELDRVFAAFGGMKPLMRLFFKRYKHRVVTTEEFWNFLSVKTKMNIDAYFYRYVWGDPSFDINPKRAFDIFPDTLEPSKHPPPLTSAEVVELR